MDVNQWFLSLPEGRQKALRDDKWLLAQAAADAASKTQWYPIETMPNNCTSVLVYCEGADCVGIAHKTTKGEIIMPEPQAIGYDSLTLWAPMPGVRT